MNKYAVEFVGTFIFLSVIIRATTNPKWETLAPILIAVGLLAAIIFSAEISGAHLNPAVSVMQVFREVLPKEELLPYVAAQVMGGLAAHAFATWTKPGPL